MIENSRSPYDTLADGYRLSVDLVAQAAPSGVVGGDDLSTALIIIGAILLGVFLLPLLMARLEPPKNDSAVRSARVPSRMPRP